MVIETKQDGASRQKAFSNNKMIAKAPSSNHHNFKFRHRHRHRGSNGGSGSSAKVASSAIFRGSHVGNYFASSTRLKLVIAKIIPCVFTLTSMALGLMALACLQVRLITGATLLIALAMLMDFLDGRFARLLHSASEFGAQLDSLADMISFGLVPSYAMIFGVHNFSYSGAILLGVSGLMFLMAVAIRLARFNCRLKEAPRDYFEGLPCPAAAGVMMLLMNLSQFNQLNLLTPIEWLLHPSKAEFVISAAALLLSALMVGRISFYNFKHARLNLLKVTGLVLIAGLIVWGIALVSPSHLIAIEISLLLGLVGYIIGVLVTRLVSYFKARKFG